MTIQASTPKWTDKLALVAVGFTAVATVVVPLLSHRVLAYYADDFFYYVQIAHNLAEHGRSTFDGSILTNGYHPLWLLALTILYYCGGMTGILFGVACCIVASTVSTYLLTEKLLIRHSFLPSIAAFWATWAALFALAMARTGMEVILTVPLLLTFVLYAEDGKYLRSPRKTVWAALLISVCILSRLDTVILLAIYICILMFSNNRGLLLRRIPWLCVGLIPVFLYVLSNIWFFGSLLPISGAAKHLEPGLVLSAKALEDLFYPLGLAGIAFLMPAILLIIAGLIYGLARHKDSAFVWSMLAFAPVYLTYMSFSSDWGLWIWYRYPFLISAIAGVLLLREAIAWQRMRHVLTPAALVLCALFFWGLRKAPLNAQILNLALHLKSFAVTHPGIYGMGDAAGTPAVVIGQPIVQLEGLVMDKKFLEDIREQKNLLEVLKEYGVRYYVSTNADFLTNGCFALSEPKVAGPRSPHMRGTLCQAPVISFTSGEYGVWVFDLHEK